MIAMVVLGLWIAAIVGILFGLPYGQFFIGNYSWLSALFYFQIFLAISIPVLSIGFAIWSLLRTQRPGVVKLKKKLWGIWVVNLILLVSLGSFFIRDFASGGYIKNYTELNKSEEILEFNFQRYDAHDPLFKADLGNFVLVNGEFINKNIDSSFKPSKGKFGLTQMNHARANTIQEAEANAENINFNIVQNGSKIDIPRYFKLPKGKKWRDQKIRLNFEIPIGQQIKIPSKQRYNIRGIRYKECDAVDGFYYLEMTENGFKCFAPEGEK